MRACVQRELSGAHLAGMRGWAVSMFKWVGQAHAVRVCTADTIKNIIVPVVFIGWSVVLQLFKFDTLLLSNRTAVTHIN